MLIDTHIHLDAAEFDRDREDLLAKARVAGVERFIVPGVEVANFDAVERLSSANEDIAHGFGIHPLYVERCETDDLDLLEERLAKGGAVAVGEIGLDFFSPDTDAALQERFFAAQLKLAQRFELPVILHVRRAVDQVLKHLRRIELPGGIAHAFNGSRQQADIFVELGFKLGFGGAMSFDGSRRIRTLAASLPLGALVLETDAPDIPPAWAGGGRNEPDNLVRFAAILAELRGVPVAEVVAATGQNARDVFPSLR